MNNKPYIVEVNNFNDFCNIKKYILSNKCYRIFQ